MKKYTLLIKTPFILLVLSLCLLSVKASLADEESTKTPTTTEESANKSAEEPDC